MGILAHLGITVQPSGCYGKPENLSDGALLTISNQLSVMRDHKYKCMYAHVNAHSVCTHAHALSLLACIIRSFSELDLSEK